MAYERSKPYIKGQKESYKISRSKIELYTQCPRCFWLEARHKIKRPSSPPFQINKAIDELFKKEFDGYREKGEPHPIMVEYKLKNVRPLAHEKLNDWRNNFKGVETLHQPSNLHIFGAVDDVWVDSDGNLIVVDYKATAKNKEITLDAEWQNGYKRQMEIYQWLLRQNGFAVNDTGYFVYTNGDMNADGFNDNLKFRTKLIAHTGKSDWVDETLSDIKACLEGDIPSIGTAAMGGECEHCAYARARTTLTVEALQKRSAK